MNSLRNLKRRCSKSGILYIMNLPFPRVICLIFSSALRNNLQKWFHPPDAVIIAEASSRDPSVCCREFYIMMQIATETKLKVYPIHPCITVKADRSTRWFKKFDTSLTPAKFTLALNLPSRRGRNLSRKRRNCSRGCGPRQKIRTNSLPSRSPGTPLNVLHECDMFYARTVVIELIASYFRSNFSNDETNCWRTACKFNVIPK